MAVKAIVVRLLGYLLVAGALLFGGVWVAAQVDLTLFSPGTPILSSEVNANFAALDDGKQDLVTGSCQEGSAIREIAADGSVVCEVDSVGGPGSGGVTTINSLSDAIVLQGGDNVLVGNDKSGLITISAADGPEGNGHDHLGQSWSGNDPLAIGGTFSDSPFTPLTVVGAPLVLSNDATSGHALRVTESWGALLFEDVHSGIDIVDSNSFGIRIQSALNGLEIDDVFSDGVVVGSAGGRGLEIGSTDDEGIYIGQAGAQGIYVGPTGGIGIEVELSPFSGVLVNFAQIGFAIQEATQIGLNVGDATTGVWVQNSSTGARFDAEFDGVVIDAGRDGVDAETDHVGSYAGNFRNTATGGVGLFVSGGGNEAPDIVLGTTGPGDDGRIYSDPAEPSSDIFLVSQDGIRFDLDNNGGEEGSFEIYDEANNRIFNLDEAGNLALDGALSENSDRAAKRDVEAIDPLAILQALQGVPIQIWSYTDTPGVRHLGPMAQDFHAAFGLGADPTAIATVDRDGVALAAIQALYELAQTKEARIAELEAQQAALLMRLEALERGAAAGR